jgi:hypothetical protein
VDARSREAFERALSQRSRGARDEEAAPAAADAGTRTAGPEMAVWLRAELPPLDPGPPVFASSQPAVQALRAGTAAGAEGAAAARADAAAGTLRAALSGLQMPASADGLQHWQFSFSHQGAPLTGVSLTARADAPWQLQLQLPAHARERHALDARLGELRQRLSGRGADIGAIELRELHDSPDPPDLAEPH